MLDLNANLGKFYIPRNISKIIFCLSAYIVGQICDSIVPFLIKA